MKDEAHHPHPDAAHSDGTDRAGALLAAEQPGGEPGLGDQIFGVTRALRRMWGQATEGLGISPHEVRALKVMNQAEGTRPSTLAEHLRVIPRSATDVVDSLEAKELVRREPDPGDRRAVLVHVTDRGRELLGQADQARAALHREWFSVLDANEQAQLSELIGRLTQRHADD